MCCSFLTSIQHLRRVRCWVRLEDIFCRGYVTVTGTFPRATVKRPDTTRATAVEGKFVMAVGVSVVAALAHPRAVKFVLAIARRLVVHVPDRIHETVALHFSPKPFIFV
jgi:hypothetical protein